MSQEVINEQIIISECYFQWSAFRRKVMTLKIQFIFHEKISQPSQKTEMKIVLRDDCRSNSIKN